jgi:RimJ/RimL family protein N-acetyltransferase
MIELRRFEDADIPRLIGWVPDSRFLLQWAGPQYKYPLDAVQLIATFEKTKGNMPSHFMFKAVLIPQKKIIGHIELMAVDYERKTTRLGRALIGEAETRGKGYGTAMVREAVTFAFSTVGLAEITLGVYDFNESAIACYRKLGFREYEFRKNAQQIGNEMWSLIMMRLNWENWLEQRSECEQGVAGDANKPRR